MRFVQSSKFYLEAFLIAFFVMVCSDSLLAQIASSEEKLSTLSILQAGSSAPINTLYDTNDVEHTYPALGKWNLVFYWSLFCHSCIEEMPELQARLEAMKDKSFNTYFVSLDSDKMKKALKNFIKRRKFTAPVLMEKLDNDKYITADKWGVTMTPSVFIVNPEGKIVFSNQGPLDIDLFFKNLPQDLLQKNEGIDGVVK